MLNIGCHLSVACGFTSMAQTALLIGANTFQFFTRNPCGGKAKDIDTQDVKSYLEIAAQNNFKTVIAHAPYTLNLCSANPSVRKFSKDTFIDDISRIEVIPNSYYNFHPGSHTGQGADVGINQITDVINTALKSDFKTTILLETMAGKGSEIGGKLEELKQIIDRVNLSEKIGVCIDICHVFDAGYDIVNDLDGVLEKFDKIVGINKLKTVHLNDSKNPCGSRKDRHEQIGKGHIGLGAFKDIINHVALKDLPFILETPQTSLDGYAEEIKLLKSFSQ